ncbi:MAG TPA: D-alanine--D-alanine ligase family protein [Cyclobacteriaceae bacterium]|jgi:D-alanine-D-alanine ligase|nr:D-alanine--D-alanine ligase family protein [Cyclobacteriaceae bacterium]HRE66396.1 D-alanine--D-alanine ligase family protein [Cyclobacteriaceae bacterium]HRF32782.1 D-alanine--D-alanine ligase family protein [Cyclobacteriaceae bacterium]
MNKTRIAILYGGRSVEHGVSINSARNIFQYIDKNRFEPIPIGIALSGIWYKTETVSKEIENGERLSLALNPEAPLFSTASGKTFSVDLVFPVLHGTDGEDGSIQGLLKAMDIPMIGTGVSGSAMSMSKLVAKRLLKEAGLPVNKFLYSHYADSKQYSFEEVVALIGLPFMVKSSNLGSSVGVSKVKSKADFDKAVKESYKYDDSILFEEFIAGREIECAILGNAPAQASLPGEIIINKQYEFYTFDAKYVDGDAVTIDVPAKLESAVAERIREVSRNAYQALGCEDFSRVDLFLTPDGKVFVNEINTIPGFTNSSMFPMMWKERGISFTDLISKLADFALTRYNKSKRVERNFKSALNF